MEKKANTRAHI